MFVRHIQPSFAGGEVSPSLQARVDSTSYQTWLKNACNFFIHPQGGASNRPGTAYMGTAKYNEKPCRIIPFVVGEDESYILEFGDHYIRVYTSAGQILADNGSDPYEISSIYPASALAKISYTQYDQTLFLAHPNYPPQRLKRTSYGRFIIETHPVRFGPFQVDNDCTTHQMRIYSTQQTSQTAGVAATLSFSPVVDNRYFVHGYFNEELFFVPQSYGLNISSLVTAFNQQFASRGVTAVNLGGVIRITSEATNGGDWNGKILKLTYQDSFVHEPSFIIEQALTGGINPGEDSPSGEISYILESNFDFFSPLHVGGRFSLTHLLESQYQNGTLGYDTVSSVIKSSSDWRVRTSGTWYGTLVLEKSEDLGVTWQAVKHLIREEGTDNLVELGTLEDNGKIYELRLRACGITGQAGYELSSAAFIQQGIAVVTAFVNARQVVVTLERAYGSTDWTSDWAQGSFNAQNGYPACVFVYQDRLGLAGTYAEPQTLWFSKTGEYENFGHARGTLLDTDAISVNLSGKKLNAIHAVCAAGKLLIFTAGSEWSLSVSGAVTPYNIRIEQQSERGSSSTPVVMVGNRALYVQARGGALRDFYYDYASAAYIGEDLTLYAKHLFHNQEIKEICHQQEPDNLVWCVLSNGTLATLTYVAEQNVCAWTHHTTQGSFCSVCTIPNRGYDEVWFVVERDGKFFIEKLLQRLASKVPQDQVFLDASITKKSDVDFAQVDGLEYLEGKQVEVLADGNPLGPLTVIEGKIILPHAVNCVHVGLAYQAQLQTLPAVFQLTNGLSTDQKKRIVSVTLQMADSRGGRVYLEGENAEEIIQRMGESYNIPLTLKTENYMFPLSGSHTLVPSLIFSQTDPLPVTLLAVSYRVA